MRRIHFAPLLLAAALTACGDGHQRANQQFLQDAADQPGAVVTASGLVYRDIAAGTGAAPAATSLVSVLYTGKLIDGTVFDQTGTTPLQFRLDQVIPCWTEGVQRMHAGGRARLVCPPELAYGSAGAGGVIPPDSVLDFEVELVSTP